MHNRCGVIVPLNLEGTPRPEQPMGQIDPHTFSLSLNSGREGQDAHLSNKLHEKDFTPCDYGAGIIVCLRCN